MSKTTVGAGSPNAQHVQAAGLFFQSMQRNGTLNRLTGKVPMGEAGVAAGLKKQSTTDMPIVRAVDLDRGKGDEVVSIHTRHYWRVKRSTPLSAAHAWMFQSTPAITGG